MGLQEVGRLFCPRCGNATVEKVEVVIGPDGQEQYGVRRKHILRGTRFSLPKPKVRDSGAIVDSSHEPGSQCTAGPSVSGSCNYVLKP